MMLFILLGGIVITLIVCAIAGVLENTAHTIDNEDGWKDRSDGGLWKLFLYLLALFGSAALFVMGIVLESLVARGICGTLGFLLWIVLSLQVAYICTPLRMFTKKSDDSSAVLLPTLTAIVTFLIIILAAWAFGLITLLRNAPRWVRIGMLVVLVLALVAVVAVAMITDIEWGNNKTDPEQLVLDKFTTSIEVGGNVYFTNSLTDEEKTHYYNWEGGFFEDARVRKMLADRFAELYTQEDFVGILSLTDYLCCNYSKLLSFVDKQPSLDIVFTEDFLAFLEENAQKGELVDEDDHYNYYIIDGREIRISDDIVMIASWNNTGTAAYYSQECRQSYYQQANMPPEETYLLVGKSIEEAGN